MRGKVGGWNVSIRTFVAGLAMVVPAGMATGADDVVPDLEQLVARDASPMAAAVTRYRTDMRALSRRHDVGGTVERREALRQFTGD